MRQIINLVTMFTILIVASSCNSTEMTYKSSQSQYMDLYRSSCDSLKKYFLSTRSEAIEGNSNLGKEVTEEEINKINNLRTLVTYNKNRLLEIEGSAIYQEKYLKALTIESQTTEKFIRAHSEAELDQLVDFVESYIKAGTHNNIHLNNALIRVGDQEMCEYVALSAALVDAYGEEEVWKETFEIVSLHPCDKYAIQQVSLVLVTVALNISIDTVIPWGAILNAATTLDSICSLITIHNNWVACHKRTPKT